MPIILTEDPAMLRLIKGLEEKQANALEAAHIEESNPVGYVLTSSKTLNLQEP